MSEQQPSGQPSVRSAGGGQKRRAHKARPEPGERGLHALVGAGSSQLGISRALRGRDVNRPTEDDLAEAERTTMIVRRNWKPPA